MAKYLLTGATGFLGQALTERLLEQGHEVIGLSRAEGKLVEYKQKFPETKIILGDVADCWSVKEAMKNVDGVFHLAATKSVDIAETQPYQTVKTNVIGTQNIIKESFNTKPNFVLFISTDKAAQVSGVYGATKFLGEKLFTEAEKMNPETKYRIVRYGNVMWSTGSVLCKWKEKILKGEKVMITDPFMTRFFWTREEAIDLIFKCLEEAKDATPWIPKMKAMKMGNILEAMMKKYGEVEVEEIGNRGGENTHETMDGKTFSNEVEQFSVVDIMEKL